MFKFGDIIIQKQLTTAYTSDSGVKIDCDAHYFNDWGLRVEELPLTILGEAKELYKNTWYDEDGDDEYVPNEMPLESYELEMTLGSYAGVENIRSFLDYLRLGGAFMMYFPDRGFGIKNVRYLKTETDAYQFKHKVRENGVDTEKSLVIFKVTVKVNSPASTVAVKYYFNDIELAWDETTQKWYNDSSGTKIYYEPNSAKLS